MTDLPDLCREATPADSGVGVADPSAVDKTRLSSTGGGDWSTTPSSKSLSSSVDKASSVDEADEQCGWGPLHPRCCQVFRSPKVVLFFLCCLATIQVISFYCDLCFIFLPISIAAQIHRHHTVEWISAKFV